MHHAALCCTADSSSFFLTTVSCPLSLPISLHPARHRRCEHEASRRAQLRVADACRFCRCPPSTDDRCQGSSWMATLHHAPLFSAPLDTPVCLADTVPNLTAPCPFPPAPPIHSLSRVHTHLCIHQSSVITSDSHQTPNHRITC